MKSRKSVVANFKRLAWALLAVQSVLAFDPAVALEKISVGAIGSASPLGWPWYIGLKKGLFAAEGLDFDLIFTPSAPNLLQQLSAGSLDLAMSSGLVDPIRAINKGASVALILVELQAAPYVLMAKPEIKSLASLKGKTIAVGGFNDITNIYLDRMVAPSNIHRGEFDMKFFGNTPSRYAALQAGAVDAAMLSPPANFYAEAAGYNRLGFVKDYAGDLPFSGSAVNKSWAEQHRDLVKKIVAVYAQGVGWFLDDKNRDEAVKIMAEVSQGRSEDILKSYDFLRQGDYFATNGVVSKSKLKSLVAAMHQLGDIETMPEPEQLVLPGVTTLVD